MKNSKKFFGYMETGGNGADTNHFLNIPVNPKWCDHYKTRPPLVDKMATLLLISHNVPLINKKLPPYYFFKDQGFMKKEGTFCIAHLPWTEFQPSFVETKKHRDGLAKQLKEIKKSYFESRVRAEETEMEEITLGLHPSFGLQISNSYDLYRIAKEKYEWSNNYFLSLKESIKMLKKRGNLLLHIGYNLQKSPYENETRTSFCLVGNEKNTSSLIERVKEGGADKINDIFTPIFGANKFPIENQGHSFFDCDYDHDKSKKSFKYSKLCKNLLEKEEFKPFSNIKNVEIIDYRG